MTHRLIRICKATLYWFIFLLAYTLTKVLFRLRVHGRNMIRRGQGYIAVARHRSYWDAPILAAAVGWPNRLHFVARKGLLRKLPVLMPFIRLFSTMIDRDAFRLADYRRLRAAVKRERLIGIFRKARHAIASSPRRGLSTSLASPASRFCRSTSKRRVPTRRATLSGSHESP